LLLGESRVNDDACARDGRDGEGKGRAARKVSEAQVGSNAGVKLEKREIENPGNQ